MALPLFTFLDKQMQQLQTQWANVLNPVVTAFGNLNAKPPTQKVFLGGQSGIYKTPSDCFYLNVIMGSGAANTTFGSGLLTALANNAGASLPNNLSVYGFFYPNNRLDAIITNPNASYPYSVASGTSAFILVREFYQ